MALVSRRSGEDEDTIFLVKQQGSFPSPGEVGGPQRHIQQHMQSSRSRGEYREGARGTGGKQHFIHPPTLSCTVQPL